MCITQKIGLPLHRQTTRSECSAVGSALRSGRRGRAFESPHSDQEQKPVQYRLLFFCAFEHPTTVRCGELKQGCRATRGRSSRLIPTTGEGKCWYFRHLPFSFSAFSLFLFHCIRDMERDAVTEIRSQLAGVLKKTLAALFQCGKSIGLAMIFAYTDRYVLQSLVVAEEVCNFLQYE